MLAEEGNMKFDFRRIAGVKTSSLLAIAGALAFTQFANATVIDTSLNVRYELTSTFTPAAGTNTYDVFLAIDTSLFNGGAGFLTAVALQFNNPTSVTLKSAPGGVSDWSAEIPGGLDSGGCNGNGNFECFQFKGTDNATSVPHSSLFVFDFAVTLPGTTALSASNDIKADYNASKDNTGKNLGITSMTEPIDMCSGNTCGSINPLGGVPEPSTILMAISGLALLGLGSLRKIRS
jgi:hypothetical protein